jgi:hypothetical protein
LSVKVGRVVCRIFVVPVNCLLDRVRLRIGYLSYLLIVW